MTVTESGRELRITFRQFDGEMVGTCWCGRTHTSAHPRALWEWLDEHEHAEPTDGRGSDAQ
ncbi:hypothetical protein HC028_19170 [Planosporangium flavigriseum]|uniref:Uncharacterized protein n=1 Tax=Planosporangium flavigriseum TaxID=373681 RepID=A0A8J3PKL0_9ACTN|nr:hypothetical protein [Planosporangium flavigriseum]NJC66613.1 hypothetical protein [Planosporangium flavigriseum]GIG73486.1 hypothetical protein Pfl04_18900 [Planosporangium flavigriseum]